jgi:error-prone DNA polymerase
MGFYAPAQIVRDAQSHGVEVRPVCLNASRWDCTLEPTGHPDRFAMRLGLRQVRGLANVDAAAIVAARADRAFASIDDLWRRAHVPAASLVKIAEADGFRASMGLARREALWAIKALRDEPLPLFAAASAREQAIVPEVDEPEVVLKAMKAGREVVEDYGHTGLTLREHPAAFLRQDLARAKFMTCAAASAGRDFQSCKVAGLVLVRQRPGSAKNVTFITLEDETGVANLVVWEAIYEKHRRIVLTTLMLGVVGRIQREGEVVHVVAYKLIDLSAELASVGGREAPFPLPHGRGDEFHRRPPSPDPRAPKPDRDAYLHDRRDDRIKQKTRDFR